MLFAMTEYKTDQVMFWSQSFGNPTLVTVNHRDRSYRLFKRSFAGEFQDRFKDVGLVDYGFCYHSGAFSQDDPTWLLLERSNA